MQMANIFGFAGTVNCYRITYDSAKEDAFNMHTQHGIVKFKKNKEGLYMYKPLPCYYEEVKERNKGINQMITTVTENKTSFTKRQVEDAGIRVTHPNRDQTYREIDDEGQREKKPRRR